jgi:hypothetical protein
LQLFGLFEAPGAAGELHSLFTLLSDHKLLGQPLVEVRWGGGCLFLLPECLPACMHVMCGAGACACASALLQVLHVSVTER